MKRFIVSGVLILLSGYCFAQDSTSHPTLKWIVRPGIGAELGLSSFPGGYITDNLIRQRRSSVYLQAVSATHFFNRWGIEANVSLSGLGRTTTQDNQFQADVNSRYGTGYYITRGLENQPDPTVLKANIGPAYKVEKGRYILIARMLIGFNSIQTNNASVALKGKGTNEYINVYWQTKSASQETLTYSPSATLAYRLNRRLALCFDISYSIYRPNFTFRETTENTGVDQEMIKDYLYNKTMSQLSLGAGLMIILK